MRLDKQFDNIYTHGMFRAALFSPKVALAQPMQNAQKALNLVKHAEKKFANLVVFPELGLTGYSNQDLFLDQTLLENTKQALLHLCEETKSFKGLILIGVPISFDLGIANCAVAIHRGKILGASAKTYLPNYREYYEKRHFYAAKPGEEFLINWGKQQFSVRANLIYRDKTNPNLCIGVEICEDLWAPVPPSTAQALAGATLLTNLCASSSQIGKNSDRSALCNIQSRRCLAGYLFAAAGNGESSTDLAWDGQVEAWQLGECLGKSERYRGEGAELFVDVDLEQISQERLRTPTFRDCASLDHENATVKSILIDFDLPQTMPIKSVTSFSRFPFLPDNPHELSKDCAESYAIQIYGLKQRLASAKIEKTVIGVSGGLDSTHALNVIVKSMDELSLPRKNIIAVTMPGFATTKHTKSNATALANAFGCDFREMDIAPLAEQMLKDLQHPYASGKKVYDTTFENVQAGLRTDILFRLANKENALVVGTGDLSELALGWCTYGVGDHMSHYGVNTGAPKTLIQYLIAHVADSNQWGDEISALLRSILETEISPELIPADDSGIQQSTEQTIGPYALHDFFLYYFIRYGLKPSKIAWMAHQAWGNIDKGTWPVGLHDDVSRRAAYSRSEIKKWLTVFIKRFFASQFKRSALPDGPKLTSGGTLSPRGDWRMPSDASPDAWLQELNDNIPD